MVYRLSAPADADLVEILIEGALQFGEAQAERYHAGLVRTFELLARFPMLARERTEISDPVRVHPYGVHVIVYEVVAPEVVILRVRHGREDWTSSPAGIEPAGITWRQLPAPSVAAHNSAC